MAEVTRGDLKINIMKPQRLDHWNIKLDVEFIAHRMPKFGHMYVGMGKLSRD